MDTTEETEGMERTTRTRRDAANLDSAFKRSIARAFEAELQRRGGDPDTERALDTMQREIERVLGERGWFVARGCLLDAGIPLEGT